ncbi:MAG: ferrous iron transporter B [Clostridia bacterium]|nr:ferrous iron transporter B [Clostridia bacterium]
MGLTVGSTGTKSMDTGLNIQKKNSNDLLIALGGNPNVGKSTVFNALTGMKQHTGNWPGKTVTNACGVHSRNGRNFILVDLPGTYSLFAHSAEEEVARDFICFGSADATVLVCDATCLERNLNLVLQTIEITPYTVVCINLLDEAKRKGINIDLKKLQQLLGVPVVGTNARKQEGLKELIDAVEKVCSAKIQNTAPIEYPSAIEEAVKPIESEIKHFDNLTVSPRWAALRIIEGDSSIIKKLYAEQSENKNIKASTYQAQKTLNRFGYDENTVRDKIAKAIVLKAEDIARSCCSQSADKKKSLDRKLDKLFMGRGGIPTMLLLLVFIFWLTITGANYPSQLLSNMFALLGEKLLWLFESINAPDWLTGALIDGVYRVLTWVVAVMLPPMAIFFPLFTLLEDFGYLPRVAFNLDHSFQKAGACGKQALTMWLVYF